MGASAAIVSSVQFVSMIKVTEALAGAPAADGETVTSRTFNDGQQIYSPTTTIAISAYSGAQYTLSGGAATIDLTNLLGTQANIDGSGLKNQVIRFQNPSTNTGTLTIAPGGSNPYPIFGAGNEFDLPVGAEVTFRTDEAPAISDISGSAASEIDCPELPTTSSMSTS